MWRVVWLCIDTAAGNISVFPGLGSHVAGYKVCGFTEGENDVTRVHTLVMYIASGHTQAILTEHRGNISGHTQAILTEHRGNITGHTQAILTAHPHNISSTQVLSAAHRYYQQHTQARGHAIHRVYCHGHLIAGAILSLPSSRHLHIDDVHICLQCLF